MIRVIAPGACSSLQDLGRNGCQVFGVSEGGAMDRWAARIANGLLDNEDNDPVLEMALSGAELEFLQPNWIAVTGADLQATRDGQPLPPGRPVRVEQGTVLRFRAARRGCRAYLALRGGFAAEYAMGSCATDLRAGIGGLGGRLLRRGDTLQPRRPDMAAGLRKVPWFSVLAAPPGPQPPLLALVPGPAWSALDALDRDRIEAMLFTVGRDADRMGLRLQESLESAARVPAVISQAVVFGALQLPPDGRPILLGADRQTTGGYPLIGVVAGVDHAALAQLRSGDALGFRVVDAGAAQASWRARERLFRRWRIGVHAWWQSLADA